MAGIFLIMLLCFLLFFILTRVVWVDIIKKDCMSFALHLPVFAFHFTKAKKAEDKNRKPKKPKPSASTYKRIISRLIDSLSQSEVVIKSLTLPHRSSDFDRRTMTLPYGYAGLIYTAVAYIGSKVQKITVYDDAIILSPDTSALQCDITVKLRLYELIRIAIFIALHVHKEKR